MTSSSNKQTLVPLLVMYDLEKECYVIPVRDGGHLMLDKKTTDQQVEEGVFEAIRSEPFAVVYGLTPSMNSVDLKILITPDVVARIISNWAAHMIEFNVDTYDNLCIKVAEEELPLTLTVRWSLLGFKVIEMEL